jgi:hypothetical protein
VSDLNRSTKNMASPFTLVVALLSVQSSYAKEVEIPAAGIPDTIQFWLAPDSQWRVRTYAIDHDIHVYALGDDTEEKKISADFAVAHIKKHYSDVTASLVVLSFADPKDQKEVERVLAEHGLKGSLEVSKSGIAFYNPDRAKYRSQTTPK